ncbi:unnamed protein product [Ixodes persulcatus]
MLVYHFAHFASHPRRLHWLHQPHCRALYAGSTRKMVVCSVANCKNRSKASGRPDINSVENAKFFRLPKIITNQCKRTRELSEKRRNLWIARINRPEMNPSDHVRVCSAHFVTGKGARFLQM